MKKLVAVCAVVAAAGCGSGEQSGNLSQDIVYKSGPTTTVDETTNEVCVSGDLSGLGMTDINASIDVTLAATTVCRNNGGNTAPGQGTVPLTLPTTTATIEPRNGRAHFTVCSPSVSGSQFPTPSSQAAGCPNGNWTVDPIQTSAITVADYSVLLTWNGQSIYASSGP